MGYWNKGLEAGEIKRFTGNELKGEIVIIERRTPKGLYVRGMNNRVIWLHRDDPYKVEDVSKEQLRELGTFRFPFFEKLMVWELSRKLGYVVNSIESAKGNGNIDGVIYLEASLIDGFNGVRKDKKIIFTGESERYRASEIVEDNGVWVRPVVRLEVNTQYMTYELLEEIVEGFSIIDIVNEEEEEMEGFKEEEQVDFEFEEAEDVTGSEVDSAVDFEIADQPDFEIEGLEEMGTFYDIEEDEEEDEILELQCAYMEDEIITLRDNVGYLREDGKEKDKEIEKLNKKVKRLQKALRMVLKG